MGDILVVDDEPIFLETMCANLDSAGHVCESARTVDQALTLLSTRPFDLLLTDHDMPGRNGLGLIEEVKKRKNFSDIPIILMTGNPDPNIQNIARKIGVYQTIIKPFDFQFLLEAVDQVIGSKSFKTKPLDHQDE
ncbi:response regulator [Candidatus Nitronereus thalassa]|uniref:Response regulator n=1 Tax=Candidatus Nitronereus thalassa TaxID=3020898 RepID=A0ABU3K767_9BACT|nr:response regulator [Candidatus Nitronereus thalassa]MDT7042228.1 response regulator [Candidatus Nitronereus thalassa]